MSRDEFYTLYQKLEQATINKAFANQHYDETLQAFMNEVTKHYPITPKEQL